MARLTKSFSISIGGGGIREVSSFLERELGKNLSRLDTIHAEPISDSVTSLTVIYHDEDPDPILISNPVVGQITSTVSAPEF